MTINVILVVPATFGGDLHSHQGELNRLVTFFEHPYVGMQLMFDGLRIYREDSGPVEVTEVVYEIDHQLYVVRTSEIRVPEKYLDMCNGWLHTYVKTGAIDLAKSFKRVRESEDIFSKRNASSTQDTQEIDGRGPTLLFT